MKSSKYTQASSPNDNDFRDYANLSTQLVEEPNFNEHVIRGTHVESSCQNVGKEYVLKSGYSIEENRCDEKNANRYQRAQDFEMVCNCALKDVVYFPKARFKPHYTSEQDIVLANRSFSPLPKVDNTNFSQYSLDRKSAKCHQQRKHRYVCEQNQKILQRLERASSMKRVQSPEIINIHRANNVPYDVQDCAIKSYGTDKGSAGDDYGFRRGHSQRRTIERSVPISCL